ncbi:MAG: prepilin-type N-terminal cleavage/methylation domain-containing protein [Candidatus Riflebacteria bacterium]|nr:prepilin-type N-terminal cleavage/methylation domain-containing protein [Candidatus Riflebacteria bacterium]
MQKIRIKNRNGITFIEVMIAFLILGVIFLPIFFFLTGAVRDTEKFYTETIAISRAKFIMDTLMFQMPWWAIKDGNPCGFTAYNSVTKETDSGVGGLISRAVPKMFGDGSSVAGEFKGNGLFVCRKGFRYRARAKVVDLDYDSTSANPVVFSIPIPGSLDRHEFQINQLVSKRDDKFNLIKKIVVQVKWSNNKNRDPDKDPFAKSIFLVGFKSDLEG